MSKDPAFLFYPADFQIGTEDMSDEQVGKYIRLMCRQHLKGHIAEEHMLKICGTYDKDIFEKFCQDESGCYYNERLEAEIIKRRNYSNSRSLNRQGKKAEPIKAPEKKPKKAAVSYMQFEELSFVNLTATEYKKIAEKYGKQKSDAAIRIFDEWLGKKGKTAVQYIGKGHYSHFRSDSWVWERAESVLKKEQSGKTNYGI